MSLYNGCVCVCAPFPQILWTFSIYLESVAIMPQLYMISKTGEAETITSHYLFALGSYRGLYIVNWVYRYYMEGFYDLIAIVAGCVQTALYCDFFYLYITKGMYTCVDTVAGAVTEPNLYVCCMGNPSAFLPLCVICVMCSYERQRTEAAGLTLEYGTL